MENENRFEFTYSAKEQEEVRRIREKYVPAEQNKLEQLRRLDAGVTRKGTVVSLIAGVLGCLIFGTGLSCCLVWGDTLFLPGVLIGIAGIIGMIAAYPLYARITAKEKERVTPEILRLTEELIK